MLQFSLYKVTLEIPDYEILNILSTNIQICISTKNVIRKDNALDSLNLGFSDVVLTFLRVVNSELIIDKLVLSPFRSFFILYPFRIDIVIRSEYLNCVEIQKSYYVAVKK